MGGSGAQQAPEGEAANAKREPGTIQAQKIAIKFSNTREAGGNRPGRGSSLFRLFWLIARPGTLRRYAPQRGVRFPISVALLCTEVKSHFLLLASAARAAPPEAALRAILAQFWHNLGHFTILLHGSSGGDTM